MYIFGAREAGCVREVAALYSDHYREVPLYEELEEVQVHGMVNSRCVEHVHAWFNKYYVDLTHGHKGTD